MTVLDEANETVDRLANKTVCPHCWESFRLDELLAIAQHSDLRGDPVLGPDAFRRFTPISFTVEGHALDSHNVVCPAVACPHCRLPVPRAMLGERPLAVSLIGAPFSGKSFLLASMVRELGRVLPHDFGFAFDDTDAGMNSVLNAYIQTLFVNAKPNNPVTLEKTQLFVSDVYEQIVLDGMPTHIPKPFLFTLRPTARSAKMQGLANREKRVFALFDNAGEFFTDGYTGKNLPGVRHLVHSAGLLFLYDPTKDPEFRKLYPATRYAADPQLQLPEHVVNQGRLLVEAVNRIRAFRPTATDEELDRPVVVILGKYDVLLKKDSSLSKRNPWTRPPGEKQAVLDMEYIRRESGRARALLQRLCPELVATAEDFSSNVTYVPCSALGHSPEMAESGKPANPSSLAIQAEDEGGPTQGVSLVVRPKNIKPIWGAVPLLALLAQLGFMPSSDRNSGGSRKP